MKIELWNNRWKMVVAVCVLLSLQEEKSFTSAFIIIPHPKYQQHTKLPSITTTSNFFVPTVTTTTTTKRLTSVSSKQINEDDNDAIKVH